MKTAAKSHFALGAFALNPKTFDTPLRDRQDCASEMTAVSTTASALQGGAESLAVPTATVIPATLSNVSSLATVTPSARMTNNVCIKIQFATKRLANVGLITTRLLKLPGESVNVICLQGVSKKTFSGTKFRIARKKF